MNRKQIGAILIALGLIVGVGGTIKSAHVIKAGNVGIIYNLYGGIEDKTLTQGLNFVAPWKSVEQYSVSTTQGALSKSSNEGKDKTDESFDVPSSDGKSINVDLEYSYHFDPQTLPKTYTHFQGKDGDTIESTFIRMKLKTWAGEVSSTFSVMDIYGDKRSELNAKLLKHIKENFEEYGIIIDTVNFSRIQPDADTLKVIQNNINARQEVETAKLQQQKAQIEADTKVVQAQAEAKVNEAKSNSISDKILQDKFLDKWDGKMPTVTGGNGTMMDISSLMGKK